MNIPAKKPVALLPFAIVLISLAQSANVEGDDVSVKLNKARLSEQISIQAAGRGAPFISLSDGRDVIASYSGPGEIVGFLQRDEAQARSLASADFDEDGVADLVSGYAIANGGVITLHRGNIDSIYPNSPEAKQRRAEGAFTESPFLGPARAFASPEAADFIGAGDFDADGHRDIVTAARGSDRLYLLKGDGHGGLGEPAQVDMPGSVTALITGEINRRDGLDDIVVGVVTAEGPKVLVYEGPEGALRGDPEAFAVSAEVTSLALGQIDDSYEMDLAIAAGRDLVLVHGRDRKLSLDARRRSRVPYPKIQELSYPQTIKSLALGDFTNSTSLEIALLIDDGSLHSLSPAASRGKKRARRRDLSRWEDRILLPGEDIRASLLFKAKVSSLPGDDLILVDSTRNQLCVLAGEKLSIDASGDAQESATKDVRVFAAMDAAGDPVAVLPMRLDEDALNDLVLLRSGACLPSVVTSARSERNSGSILSPQEETFSNPSFITINDTQTPPAPATPYPSTISVSGVSGTVNRVRVTLTGISHTFPDDVDILLVGPQGQKVILMSDVGSFFSVSNVTLTFDDAASSFLPDEDQISSGTFRPTDVNPGTGTDTYPAPAPAGPYATSLSVFNGTDPNGNWNLYVVDDESILAGSISGGWSLTFGDNNVLVVTNTDDSGPGSLRQAITQANTTAGADIIHFAIPGSGVKTINLQSGLPHITEAVTIDGTTQPGFSGAPLIEINGAGAGSAQGLNISGGNSTIRGLIINRFASDGLVLATGGGNRIEGNYIGTNASGTAAAPNGGIGVLIVSSANNLIGGTVPAARNIISGNTLDGVTIFLPEASNNFVQGNYIGTDVSGTAPVGNSRIGIFVPEAPFNTIGGTTAGSRNILSGNGSWGIQLQGGGAKFDLVQGNFIGTDLTGTSAIGNHGGVYIISDTHTLGGTVSSARNIISGNFDDCLVIALGDFGSQIQGNYIGLDVNGAPLGNANTGVWIFNAPQNTIGGATPNARNIISNNGGAGISIYGGDSNFGPARNAQFNDIQGNLIGTDINGLADMGNGSDGVRVTDATDNVVGGPAIEARNIISGNGGHGISIGIRLIGPAGTPGAGQLPGSGGTGIRIQNNYIGSGVDGTTPLGNIFNGIFVDADSVQNFIEGNLIAFNGNNGVCIPDNNAPGLRISILSNSIFSNGIIGVDLGPPGITNNDSRDTDTGANLIQNNPVLVSATTLGTLLFEGRPFGPKTTGTIRIVGTLHSTPNTLFFVQFFSAAQCSNSNPGGNQQSMNSTPIAFVTDANGNAQIDVTLPNVTIVGGWVNALASDPTGNTSEFSQCIQVNNSSACSYSISSTGQSFSSSGGTDMVSVTAGAGCVWPAISNDSFITITSAPDGTGNGAVSYQVAANPGSSERMGTMTIAGRTFTVTQAGAAVPCSFSLSDDSENFLANGGSGSFNVITGSGCNWSPITNVGWISASVSGSTVNYFVDRNDFGGRSGQLTVQDRVFTVTQDGVAAPCTYSIPSGPATFPANGGSDTITLTTGASCGWNAAANVPWIVVPSSGVGGGPISYTVLENSGLPRTGKIFIEGQEFTVNQGASCAFALNKTSASFAGNGGTDSVIVTAADGCIWTTTNNNPEFITITSPDIASGSGSISFNVAANPASTIRSGTITVAGQTFTVFQGINFTDVPPSHTFYTEIGKLSARGVTLGCDVGLYCPDLTVTRQQMAAFIIRALGDFNPPQPAMQRFIDVPPANPFYAFIEQMAVRQITLGCSPNMYCPTDPVLRDQMAAFIIRALHEPGYIPPTPAMQRFADVPPSNPFYAHIEEMAVRQVTLGCGAGIYCPTLEVSRGQMAAFLVRAFGL